MGYDDIIPELHGSYCQFLEHPAQRKQATMPRSFVKTWIGSIAYPIWITLPRGEADEFPYEGAASDKFWQLGPNMRILIASYVITNAEKMISLIRKTYENNTSMQILFPEVIPHNFNKTKWSNSCACINRDTDFTESTFEAGGLGGSTTSKHYDLIIEDDLIYAKKDDFTDRELQPNREDIDQAIGWHKLASSLLVPGKHTHIHNQGTRWARHDLVDYIWENEKSYDVFKRACVRLEEGKKWDECVPEWSGCYDISHLREIAQAQGYYMFSTQYLLFPISPEELLFKPEWIQYYKHVSEVPSTIRKFTTVDVAEWSEPTRKSDCNAVVLTCGWCDRHHGWILHYDVGRFNPTEIILLMAKHWKMFSPEYIGVEAVYYQKAIKHFAREYAEMGKVPFMRIRELKPEGNASKEIRIMGIEPLASNLALHCRPEHREFISEYTEYVPNNKLCKKDILDTLAYQIQIARPGIAQALKKRGYTDQMPSVSMDAFLGWAWGRNRKPSEVLLNPYSDDPNLDPLKFNMDVDMFPEEVDWDQIDVERCSKIEHYKEETNAKKF